MTGSSVRFGDEVAKTKMHAEFAAAPVADRRLLHDPPEEIAAGVALIESAREAGELTHVIR